MTELKFSIIIPSYNQGEFIEQTLLSIINQEYKNFEIIVIDGGSHDQTVDVIKKYSQHIAYWVSEPDEGQSHAIIKGFEKSSGEILSWLNSDDVYLPHALKSVAEAFLANNADVVYGNKKIIDENGVVVSSRLLTPFLPSCLRNAAFCGGFGIYQPASFWTRIIYDKSGGIEKSMRFCMDNDLYYKFLIFSAEFCFVDEFLAGFRVHSASKTSTLNHVQKAESLALYNKYVVEKGIRFSSFKRFLARTYRLLWLLRKGKLPEMVHYKFIDKLKWVP